MFEWRIYFCFNFRTVQFKSTAGYRNYYDVLGVDKHATQETIKAQFIKLSKEVYLHIVVLKSVHT